MISPTSNIKPRLPPALVLLTALAASFVFVPVKAELLRIESRCVQETPVEDGTVTECVQSITNSGSDPLETASAPIRTQVEPSLAQNIPSEDRDTEVFIPDGNLRQIIKSALINEKGVFKTDVQPVTRGEMAMITSLVAAPGLGIADLTGLEFAVNLKTLVLSGNSISDLTPISDLLRKAGTSGGVTLVLRGVVDLSDNQIVDIGPLFSGPSLRIDTLDLSGNRISGFESLRKSTIETLDLSDTLISNLSWVSNVAVKRLDLSGNAISDVSALSGIVFDCCGGHSLDLSDNAISNLQPLVDTRPQFLDLSRNPLSDLSPLSHMNSLYALYISGVGLTDISFLAGPTNLRHIDLSGNEISDISVLAGAVYSNLFHVNLSDNKISDISSLAGLTGLLDIDLSDNEISDISALAGAERLETADLSDNEISDISPLGGFSGYTLDLSGNQISDLGPFANISSSYFTDLSRNQISDLSPLNRNLSGYFDLSYNHISSLESLSLPRGRYNRLNLSNNDIADIRPLADPSYSFESLYLWGNSITDLAPLLDTERPTVRNLHLTCTSQNLPVVGDVAEQNALFYLMSESGGLFQGIFQGIDCATDASNPLDRDSIDHHIRQLQLRGVLVYYHSDDAAEVYLNIALLDAIGRDRSSEFRGYKKTNRARLATVTRISASNLDIQSLEGLEFAQNLTDADLSGNRISDISALSSLTDLQRLNLSDNRISDISALSSLTDLQHLNLSLNSIVDVSPLSGLTELLDLNISANSIASIAPLANLTNLMVLKLARNSIVEITALANLVLLTELDLTDNLISNLWPLQGPMASLEKLKLAYNKIVDVSPLGGGRRSRGKYLVLDLSHNAIADVSALAGLGSLNVDLSYNVITDPRPLLPHIRADFSYNLISDVNVVRAFLIAYGSFAFLLITNNPVMEDAYLRAVAPEIYASREILNTAIDIPDDRLRACINEAVGSADLMAPVTPAVLWKLDDELRCVDRGIADLSGLEHAIRLVDVNLAGNDIQDITPLARRKNHYYNTLNLDRNRISDLSPLIGLRIGHLYLSSNAIVDIAPLSSVDMGFRERRWDPNAGRDVLNTFPGSLDLSHNSIVDIAPLVDLSGELNHLDLSGNSIADIGSIVDVPLNKYLGITGLTNDVRLYLSENSISDIAVFGELLPVLDVLDLSDNLISNIAPLVNVKFARSWGSDMLDLSGNAISDISVIADIQEVRRLDLSDNSVSDIFPLSGMNLVSLDLSDNSVSDISPLSGMNLESLDLSDNEIVDLRPLANVAVADPDGGLTYPSSGSIARREYLLDLSNNSIADIRPLADMPAYPPEIYLADNLISDIQPLADMYHRGAPVGVLDLSGNLISDIRPLAGLIDVGYPNMFLLDLSRNAISDVEVLAGAEYFRVLDISENQIVDIASLSGLTGLRLSLWGNLIENVQTVLPTLDFKEIYFDCCPPGQPHGDSTASNPLSEESLAAIRNYQLDALEKSLCCDSNYVRIVIHSGNPLVNIPDDALKSGIGALVGVSPLGGFGCEPLECVTAMRQMESLESLTLEARGIADLTGLEYAVNLRALDVSDNAITDLSPLAGLNNLSNLDVSDNAITDIAPLSSLPLQVVDLSDNRIVDIGALRDWVSFKSDTCTYFGEIDLSGNSIAHISAMDGWCGGRLDLSSNVISDISPLENVTIVAADDFGRLNDSLLDLSDNQISDLQPLAAINDGTIKDDGFPLHINSLYVAGNQIKDLSLLAGMRIRHLNAARNLLSDIAPLATLGHSSKYTLNLHGLIWLDLSANAIVDLSPLSELPLLSYLDLSNNSISDISSLSGLISIYHLDLSSNAIADISALAGFGPRVEQLEWGQRTYAGLRHLDLSDNLVADIRPLAGLGSLFLEGAAGTPGSTGSPGYSVGGLEYLALSSNAIADISALGEIDSLRQLYLSNNFIRDVTPLAPLNLLRELDLRDNWITDVGPLLSLSRAEAHSSTPIGLRVQLSGNPLDEGAIGYARELRLVGIEITGYMLRPEHRAVDADREVRPASVETTYTVPYFPSASNALREGVVRVVNRSRHRGEIWIDPVDDSGRRFDRVTLTIGPHEVAHFNSEDLEMGNPGKAMVGSTGTGVGDWRLEFSSRLDGLQVVAFVRTTDGFLTAIHDVSPLKESGFWIPMFNPGSNRNQVSLLRLVNTGEGDVEIKVAGTDDQGNVSDSEVRVTVPEGAAHTISAMELENGGSGFQGALGDGDGRWRLSVEASETPGRVLVMSLLESPTGRISNLSTIPAGQDDRGHSVLLFPSAAHADGVQGLVRIVNRSDKAGKVTVAAFDQTEREYEPITLAIGAGQAAHFNSDDLEQGNPAKGLTGRIGSGSGDWRLVLSSELDIVVLSYIIAPDGFLTAMHDVAPAVPGGQEVVTFNPGSNLDQLGMLRIFNPGPEVEDVNIKGIDDKGESPGAGVSVAIPVGVTRSYTAAELEAGGGRSGDLRGVLGDGTGKWRLLVKSRQPLTVMSLLKSSTGHIANLSTAPNPVYEVLASNNRMLHLPAGAEVPEMVDIPAGQFPMGCWSKPVRGGQYYDTRVDVHIGEPFAMSKYEITFAQWEACVAGGGCYGYYPDDEGWGRGDRPIINVNWYDARSYADWLSAVTGDRYRLPSGAEWEYAAVAGSPDDHYNHDDGRISCIGTFCTGNLATRTRRPDRTLPVGSFPANPWGLHDMLGNVDEWTLDCGDDACFRRVRRGEAFNDDFYGPPLACSENAGLAGPRGWSQGFRVVRESP